MKSKAMFVFIGLVLAAVLSACGTPAAGVNPYNPYPQLSVNGNGQVYIVPDLAYINIGVHSEAEDVQTALNDNNNQAQAIRETLTGMGVAEEDIQTTAFNVYPTQEYDPMGQPLGLKYVVENTVMVTVRDLSNLGGLLDSAVQSGANTINSITFDASDKAAAYTEARKIAVDNAKALATELAEASGVTLGKLMNISTYNSSPQPYYDMKSYSGVGGAESVPVAAGQIVISVDVSLIYSID